MSVSNMRTPLGRVRGLGSAKSGTGDFWKLRLTSVASIPLTIAGIVIAISLLGRNHAATAQILGSPVVAILMLLFIVTNCIHMRLGMQVVIEDYVHEDKWKIVLVMFNVFYCAAVGLAAAFAILKLSFGV